MEEAKYLQSQNLCAEVGPEVPIYDGKEVIQGAEKYTQTANLTTIPQAEEARYPQQQPHQQYQPQYQQLISEDETPPKTKHPEKARWNPGRRGWIVIAVLVALVIIAAVGGGVGGSIAVQRARDSVNSAASPVPTTPTSTSQVSEAAQATTSTSTYFDAPVDVTASDVNVTVALDCDALSGKTATVRPRGVEYNFQLECGTDITSGSRLDLAGTTAYSHLDCLRACAFYNINSGNNSCVAVTYNAEVSPAVKAHGANCFLKNSTQPAYTGSNKRIISGLLLA